MERTAKPLRGATTERRPTPPRAIAVGSVRPGRDDSAFERNLHSQLAGRLGRDIVAGVYPPGSLLPTAPEM